LDRLAWFSPGDARLAMNPAQAELLDRLLAILAI
jgi:predicted NUDIX family NTP pyrophosphohydrolase